MVMVPVALSSNLPLIQWEEGQIERVSSFKLLGLSNLFYHRHLVYIVYFRHLAILYYSLAL